MRSIWRNWTCEVLGEKSTRVVVVVRVVVLALAYLVEQDESQ
jgi:hypothetical protein